MSIENDEQAFPAAWGNSEQGGDYVPGMTLRDWFAGQAITGILMHGMFMSPSDSVDEQEWWNNKISQEAYDIADAMLAARKTSTGQ